MTHPGEKEMTAAEKAAALKKKLADSRAKQKKGSKPAKKKAAPKKSTKKAAPKRKAATKKKAPAKKVAPKKSTKKVAPRKAATGGTKRTRDRDKEGDGLRPIERDIVNVCKNARGRWVSIINITCKVFGVDEPSRESSKEGANDGLVRQVRNGVRKPIELGYLERPRKNDKENKGKVRYKSTASKPKKAAAKAKAKAGAKAKKASGKKGKAKKK